MLAYTVERCTQRATTRRHERCYQDYQPCLRRNKNPRLSPDVASGSNTAAGTIAVILPAPIAHVQLVLLMGKPMLTTPGTRVERVHNWWQYSSTHYCRDGVSVLSRNMCPYTNWLSDRFAICFAAHDGKALLARYIHINTRSSDVSTTSQILICCDSFCHSSGHHRFLMEGIMRMDRYIHINTGSSDVSNFSNLDLL